MVENAGGVQLSQDWVWPGTGVMKVRVVRSGDGGSGVCDSDLVHVDTCRAFFSLANSMSSGVALLIQQS